MLTWGVGFNRSPAHFNIYIKASTLYLESSGRQVNHLTTCSGLFTVSQKWQLHHWKSNKPSLSISICQENFNLSLSTSLIFCSLLKANCLMTSHFNSMLLSHWKSYCIPLRRTTMYDNPVFFFTTHEHFTIQPISREFYFKRDNR